MPQFYRHSSMHSWPLLGLAASSRRSRLRENRNRTATVEEGPGNWTVEVCNEQGYAASREGHGRSPEGHTEIRRADEGEIAPAGARTDARTDEQASARQGLTGNASCGILKTKTDAAGVSKKEERG